MAHYIKTSLVLAGLTFSPALAMAQYTAPAPAPETQPAPDTQSTPDTAQDAATPSEAATVKVGNSDEYGSYLTDGEGRSLYMFESDTQGQGDTQATVSCNAECMARWPALQTEGEPEAGDQIDASLLGTVEHEGQTIVTYNGWPLYHFVEDTAPGDTKGQDIEEFGAEWYLVTPQGEKVED
jgi:predicted lipoprotein with Yx(FWY)xxD motif